MSKNYMVIQQLSRIVRSLPNAELYQKYEIKENKIQPVEPLSLKKEDPIVLDDDIDDISQINGNINDETFARKISTPKQSIEVQSEIRERQNMITHDNTSVLLGNDNVFDTNGNNLNRNNTTNLLTPPNYNSELSVSSILPHEFSSIQPGSHFMLPQSTSTLSKQKKSQIRMNELKFDTTPSNTSSQSRRRRLNDIDMSLIDKNDISSASKSFITINSHTTNTNNTNDTHPETQTIQLNQQNPQEQIRMIEHNGKQYFDISSFSQLYDDDNERDMTSYLEEQITDHSMHYN